MARVVLLKMLRQREYKSFHHDASVGLATLLMTRPRDITDALRAIVASRMLAASEIAPIVDA